MIAKLPIEWKRVTIDMFNFVGPNPHASGNARSTVAVHTGRRNGVNGRTAFATGSHPIGDAAIRLLS
jgi:ABC-type sulfate transport system substrate-binding protein